ncbi:MAG: hypothetical protein EA413_12175 [Cyanobium sp. PLM2.Bin73]|nr:MAG: hypothetical protein EA413_12175 [Cyanobium sp. PLM2.Bin73]
MSPDPISLLAGQWLGAASGLLGVLTIAGFALRWGIRFRLVGITSFTVLLCLSCLAFSVSYRPRVVVEGAVGVPVVFDNGGDLVVAAAPADLDPATARASAEQVARNLSGGGRTIPEGLVRVRLRGVDRVAPGLSRPLVLAEATRNFDDGTVSVDGRPAATP